MLFLCPFVFLFFISVNSAIGHKKNRHSRFEQQICVNIAGSAIFTRPYDKRFFIVLVSEILIAIYLNLSPVDTYSLKLQYTKYCSLVHTHPQGKSSLYLTNNNF